MTIRTWKVRLGDRDSRSSRKPGRVGTTARINAKTIAKLVKTSANIALMLLLSDHKSLDCDGLGDAGSHGFTHHKVVVWRCFGCLPLSLFLSSGIHVSVEDVYASVLGGHGDSMVPPYSLFHGGRILFLILFRWSGRLQERIERIVQRTRQEVEKCGITQNRICLLCTSLFRHCDDRIYLKKKTNFPVCRLAQWGIWR